VPLIEYIPRRFSKASQVLIAHANAIIEEYAEQGFVMTLRQLYYQFVSRDLLGNTPREYDRLERIISNGRNAGLIDWEAIEDRTRNVQSNSHWDGVSDILDAVAQQFRYDLWENQRHRVEVWVEKEALSGVFDAVCRELDVPLLACRGFLSQSEMWAAGRRFKRYAAEMQSPVVIYLGDHDPSGIDMTRDNFDRLKLYSERYVEVHRIALNMDQVQRYQPPPNPAKSTDSRFTGYVEKYGDESWELDALSPAVLVKLVRDAVADYRDEYLWDAAVKDQQEARDDLQQLADERRQQ